MAKAKQLPSGSWRVQVYNGKKPNGKPDYISITATSEKEANYLALEHELHFKEIRKDSSKMTIDEAITKYIKLKSHILSPSSIRSYETMRKNRLKGLMNVSLDRLTSKSIQEAINEESATLSPNTVKCTYGLLSTVLSEYRPDFKCRIKMPKAQKYHAQFLNESQIETLLKIIAGTDIEVPMLLAVWLGLRRSEICGLTWDCIDFENKTILVRAALVLDIDNHFVLKGTKTVESSRKLNTPEYILNKIKELPRTGKYLFTMHPNTIRKQMKALLVKNGLPNIRLHDLRRTNASVMLSLGINDKVAQERGGWADDRVMKRVYQHTMTADREEADKRMNDYFGSLAAK